MGVCGQVFLATVRILMLTFGKKLGFNKAYYGYALPCRPWRILKPPVESKFDKKRQDAFYILPDSETERLFKLFSILEK